MADPNPVIYDVVCNGYEDAPHEQIKLSNIEDGLLKRRSGKCEFNEDYQVWTLKCPKPRCPLCVRVRSESIPDLVRFFVEHPQLLVTRVVPERFADVSQSGWRAIRLQTLARVVSKSGRHRKSSR